MGFVRIPPALAPQRDASVAALALMDRNDSSLFAIIDLAAATDATHWHEQLMHAGNASSLFESLPESSAALQAPWLLQLGRDATRNLLRRTVDEALAAQNVSWVASSLSLGELQTRLARRMTARISQGEALFRYYDPRLLSAWWASLTPEERDEFGGFGTRWWTFNADNVLQVIDLSGAPSDDPLQPPWYVSSMQNNALTAASECHQLVGFLAKRQPGAAMEMTRGERWRFVCTHDAQARAQGVENLADRVKYCELALQYGDDFAAQPEWQRVWAALQCDRKLRLGAAIERFQPTDQVTAA